MTEETDIVKGIGILHLQGSVPDLQEDPVEALLVGEPVLFPDILCKFQRYL